MSERDDIVRLEDLRASVSCWKGTCKFLLRHGFSPREFRKNGIPAKEIIATGDAIAARVVEVSRGRKK